MQKWRALTLCLLKRNNVLNKLSENPERQSDHHDYQSQLSDAEHALATWIYTPEQASVSTVIPDGCIDFIVYVDEHAASGFGWMLSELSTSAYQVNASAGEHMQGIRLKPGVALNVADLESYITARSPQALLEKDAIDEFCLQSSNANTALQCLASGLSSVDSVANELGVSVRTLQRLIKTTTGCSPYFWLSLARARKAAKALLLNEQLSQVAAAHNFYDQAHMCREMQHWFKQTPSQLKKNSDIQLMLNEPAYI